MCDHKICCDIEHHAVLFGVLAREVITLCPESGIEAIRSSVRKYGQQRGGRMAQRCLSSGDPLSPPNYQVYNERSSRPGQMNSVPAQRLPEYVIHVKKCAWVDAWEKYDLLDYGKYYCLDIDKSLTSGFSPGYEVQIGGWLSWGNPYCDMHWGFPMDEKTERYIAEKRSNLSNDAIRTYNFHTGHLFSTMVTELVHLLGEPGKQASIRGLNVFKELFSAEYINCFCNAYPLTDEARAIVDVVIGSHEDIE